MNKRDILMIVERVEGRVMEIIDLENESLKKTNPLYAKVSNQIKEYRQKLFGDKRIVIELSSGAKATSTDSFWKEVDSMAEAEGALVDRVNMTVKKGKNEIKLGKYLNNKKRLDLYKTYNDQISKGVSGEATEDLRILITTKKEDIVGMSTDRHWTSCKSLPSGTESNLSSKRTDGAQKESGAYCEGVISEIDLYTIAYLVKKINGKWDGGEDGQGEIENPIGRLNIVPVSFNGVINGKKGKKILFKIVDKAYGVTHGEIGNKEFAEIGKKALPLFRAKLQDFLDDRQGKLAGRYSFINYNQLTNYVSGEALPYDDESQDSDEKRKRIGEKGKREPTSLEKTDMEWKKFRAKADEVFGGFEVISDNLRRLRKMDNFGFNEVSYKEDGKEYNKYLFNYEIYSKEYTNTEGKKKFFKAIIGTKRTGHKFSVDAYRFIKKDGIYIENEIKKDEPLRVPLMDNETLDEIKKELSIIVEKLQKKVDAANIEIDKSVKKSNLYRRDELKPKFYTSIYS